LRSGQVFPDKIRANRQLAVTAIDQHGELNRGRSAEVPKRIHRCSAGAPGKEHIIDNYNRSLFEWERKLRSPNDGEVLSVTKVVAMHRNVDHPGCNRPFTDGLDFERDTLSQFDSARWNSDEEQR
jgi:hypothetical protein